MPFQKGNKFGGRRNRRSQAAAEETPLRARYEDDDPEDEDAEAEADAEDTRDGTPQEDGAVDGDEAATPARDYEEDDDEDGEDAPPTITTLPSRKRVKLSRKGGSARRSLRAERLESGTPQQLDGHEGEDGSESGTPHRRRRTRPDTASRNRGRGGFRGRRRTHHAEPPRVVIDKEGNELPVVDDEVQVDEDPEGNEKVDANGNLLGGREYRVRTFTILGKDERLYMLSTEPARCCGFRDSYLFFAKHPKLYKVLLSEAEKLDLIEREILPSSYKGRNIGVVTARSVFREFGARIIVGGRRIIDDYKVAEARANGEVEGELADPDDPLPDEKGTYNRNRYVAWFGASDVYRTGLQGSAPAKSGMGPTAKSNRRNITVGNWQFMHAREASRYNSRLATMRRANLDGVYDTHTNMMLYPKIMQPTHARWEQIPPPPSDAAPEHKALTNGLTNGHATAHPPDSNTMDLDDPHPSAAPPPPHHTIFSAVPALISRNFAVFDTVFTSPSLTSSGYPGPDGHVLDPPSGPNGLGSIPDELVEELPESCRQAFEEARKTEREWKERWGTERQDCLRGELRIGLSGYPV